MKKIFLYRYTNIFPKLLGLVLVSAVLFSLVPTARADMGRWSSGFSVNTTYTASTDGFVVVTSTEGGDQDCNVVIESPVGVKRLQSSPNGDGVQIAETAPVRKGDSWQVRYTNTGCGTTANGMLKIFWIPFDGNLGSWNEGYATNQSYTASTDGFVVVTSTEGGDQDCNVKIESPVGVLRLQSSPNHDGVQVAETAPVRKGDSWQVRYTNTGCGTTANGMLKIFWIPFDGNLGSWNEGYATNQSYTASTDGFVVVTSTEGGDQDCNVKIESPVGVLRLQSSPNHDGVQVAETAPVRKGDSWQVRYTNTGCGTTANGMLKIFWIPYSPPVGTIIEKATLDGKPWDSPPFAVFYDAPFGPNNTATIDPEQIIPAMPAGTYTLKGVTAPSGVKLADVNGSQLPYSFNLAPEGTITLVHNFVSLRGTIIEKATLDGKPWDSPPFAVFYDAPFGPNNTATIDPEQIIPAMPAGTYTLKGVTAPSGVKLADVNGSQLPYSLNLPPEGTVTITHNFVTPPPTTGILQIRATKDGVAWDSPAFPVNMLLPGGSVGDMSVNPPQDIANSPLGAYRINGVTPPAGVTFQNVNGSSLPYSQNLAGGSTITFTFNFTTTVVAVPTLVVTPTSASVGINGAQQFNAIYDPDGSGPQFSSTVTNLSGWASSNNSVATASSVGVATGVSAGSATITASYAGLTASAVLTVTAPTPTLDVTPSSAIVEIGDTKQFNAMYDPDGPSGSQSVQDVTATAVWSSADTAKVTVSSGLAVRVGHGLTNVRAVYVGLSDSAAVLDPATLRVDPRLAELVSEQTVQLKAFYDSDGSTGSDPETEVTQLTDWSSRNPAVASVDNVSAKGLVTAGSVSRTQTSDIFAGYSGLSDAARITVLAAQVPTVTLSASPSSVNSGGSSSLTWSVANANSCSASGGWSGAKSPSGGSESIGSLTVATTFTLACSNANGSSSASATVSIVASPVPQAPSNLRVVSSSLNSCGTIGLAWRDNSSSETRFEMERDSGSGFVKIAEPAQNTTNFVDTTIRQNTSYSYRVRACNSFGCSAYSNTATGNNQSPAADFKFTPANPQVNQPVLFTDMSEYFGIVASRQWTFEDGNPALVTVSGATTTAKFIDVEPEEKTVVLRAADTVGRICSIAKKVPVKLGSTPPDWEEVPPE